MSLETVIIQNGASFNLPRANIYVHDLAYDNIVDPLLFGLVANSQAAGDMTNNTTIVQNALNLGGKVCIPSGTYYFNAPLVIAVNNTWLCGAGIGLTVLKSAITITTRQIWIVNAAVIMSKVTVSDMTIDGNAANRASGDSILGTDCQNCLFKNLDIYCSAGSGIILGGTVSLGSKFNVIENCIISYPKAYGVYLAQYATDNNVEGNMLEFIGGSAAVLLETNSNNNVTDNVIFRSNGTGIYVLTAGQSIIEGNIIDRCVINCIRLLTATNSSIIGNFLRYGNQGNTSAPGVLFTTNSLTNICNENVIFDDGATISDAVTGPNGVVYPAKAFTMNYGIQLDAGSNNNNVQNNFVTAALTNRYTLNGTNNILSDPSSGVLTERYTSTVKYADFHSFQSAAASAGIVMTLLGGTTDMTMSGTGSQIVFRSPVGDTNDLMMFTNTSPSYVIASKSDLSFQDTAFTKTLLTIPNANGGVVFSNQGGAGPVSNLKLYSEGTFSLTVGAGATGAAVTAVYQLINSRVHLSIPVVTVTLDLAAVAFLLSGIPAWLQSTLSSGTLISAQNGGTRYIDSASYTGATNYITIIPNWVTGVALGNVNHVLNSFNLSWSVV